MEIIKKWKEGTKDMAWVTISDKEAVLLDVTGKTNVEILKKAESIAKLKYVQELIKNYNDGKN